MKKSAVDHVTTMASIGEAVVAIVKEAGVLRKKPGRRRGKRRARKTKGDAKPKRARSLKEKVAAAEGAAA